jgi:hypothetical protein
LISKNVYSGAASMTSSKTTYSTKYFAPFTKKMNTIAGVVLICATLLSLPFLWLSNWKYPGPGLVTTVSNSVSVIVWLYLSAILFQLYRHTHLREYILQAHTLWLAVVIIGPLMTLLISILNLFRGVIEPGLYLSFFMAANALFLALLLIIRVLSKRRATQMSLEIQGSAAIWKQLLALDLKDIALLQFPVKR